MAIVVKNLKIKNAYQMFSKYTPFQYKKDTSSLLPPHLPVEILGPRNIWQITSYFQQ